MDRPVSIRTVRRPGGEGREERAAYWARVGGSALGAAAAERAKGRARGEREFEFTERDFRHVRELLLAQAGINLSEAKRDLVYGRLARILRRKGYGRFKDYLDALDVAGRAGDRSEFINALTTNVTSFFRESHQFERMGREVMPELLERKAAIGDRRIRVWSSACSTGPEPYSIAIVLNETIRSFTEWNVRVLATDLDSNVIQTAQSGIYDAETLEALDKARLSRFFEKGTGPQEGRYRAKRCLRDLIVFKQLNLMGEWPMRGLFDVIFCRNVVIYFDKPTQVRLFERLADKLTPGGTLFIGHSESLTGMAERFDYLGGNTYRKTR